MADQPVTMSNWHAALEADGIEFMRWVILLVREFHEATGSWPTGEQILAQLHLPR